MRPLVIIMSQEFENLLNSLSDTDGVQNIKFNLSEDEEKEIRSDKSAWKVVITDGGDRLYKWQYDRLKDDLKAINAERAKMRASYNIPQAPPWGMGKANYNSVQDIPDTINQPRRDWQKFASALERTKSLTMNDYAERYKANLLNAIDSELSATKRYSETRKAIDNIDAEDIVQMYFDGEISVDFDFIYSFEEAETISSTILDTISLAVEKIKKRRGKI